MPDGVENPAEAVAIGRVGAPHGVRGTVRVTAYGSGKHLREGVEPVVAGLRRRILRVRETPKGFLVDLAGVGDRSEAAALRGEDLSLDRKDLDPPEDGEFYVSDLVGLVAFDESGGSLGIVAETFETPAHEVLVVRAEDGEILVPFTLEHVPEVDASGGRVVVRVPVEE